MTKCQLVYLKSKHYWVLTHWSWKSNKNRQDFHDFQIFREPKNDRWNLDTVYVVIRPTYHDDVMVNRWLLANLYLIMQMRERNLKSNSSLKL